MPFLRHPQSKVLMFIGRKSYDEHMAATKEQEDAKKRHDAEATRAKRSLRKKL